MFITLVILVIMKHLLNLLTMFVSMASAWRRLKLAKFMEVGLEICIHRLRLSKIQV